MYTFINRVNRRICKSFCKRFSSSKVTLWKPTVGLEIHAQINSNSKLFSAAPVDFASPVNTCVSLFDCAIPGTMPVLNRRCVEAGILTALALSCDLNEYSLFERKHYFYADLPAGFQITQQKKPLAINGKIEFYVTAEHNKMYTKSSKLKQIQLEQDSGKTLDYEDSGKVLIDLNRAGVPLMEFVFEPDLKDGEEAAALVKELMIVLKLLNTCSCKMEEGAMRVDANVSVAREGEPLGVRTEIKNIPSVRAVASAVKYEIQRHISILEAGGEIVNETRAWDVKTKKTIPMRRKEEHQDYRFMPETNLPPLRLHLDDDVENQHNLVDVSVIRKQLPDLPHQIRHKLRESYGLTFNMVSLLTNDQQLLTLFYDIVRNNPAYNPQYVALFLANELLTFIYKHKLKIEFCLEHRKFIQDLIGLCISQTITRSLIADVLEKMLSEGHKTPRQIVEENNWFRITDEDELTAICTEVIKNDPKTVRRAKSGIVTALNSLRNRVVIVSNKRADIGKTIAILDKLLQ